MMTVKNKVYQFFSDYRVPTTLPFNDAISAYKLRLLIIGAVTLAVMAAYALIALIIIIFQKGYGWIIIVGAIWLLKDIFFGGGGGGGGTSPPPSSGTPGTGKRTEEGQAVPVKAEKEPDYIPARLYFPKPKEMARRLDDDDKG
jgi:hypothetical protein